MRNPTMRPEMIQALIDLTRQHEMRAQEWTVTLATTPAEVEALIAFVTTNNVPHPMHPRRQRHLQDRYIFQAPELVDEPPMTWAQFDLFMNRMAGRFSQQIFEKHYQAHNEKARELTRIRLQQEDLLAEAKRDGTDEWMRAKLDKLLKGTEELLALRTKKMGDLSEARTTAAYMYFLVYRAVLAFRQALELAKARAEEQLAREAKLAVIREDVFTQIEREHEAQLAEIDNDMLDLDALFEGAARPKTSATISSKDPVIGKFMQRLSGRIDQAAHTKEDPRDIIGKFRFEVDANCGQYTIEQITAMFDELAYRMNAAYIARGTPLHEAQHTSKMWLSEVVKAHNFKHPAQKLPVPEIDEVSKTRTMPAKPATKPTVMASSSATVASPAARPFHKSKASPAKPAEPHQPTEANPESKNSAKRFMAWLTGGRSGKQPPCSPENRYLSDDARVALKARLEPTPPPAATTTVEDEQPTDEPTPPPAATTTVEDEQPTDEPTPPAAKADPIKRSAKAIKAEDKRDEEHRQQEAAGNGRRRGNRPPKDGAIPKGKGGPDKTERARLKREAKASTLTAATPQPNAAVPAE